MRVLNYQEYMKEKEAFFKKHNYDYSVNTSSLKPDGAYSKEYGFSDSANWSEVMMPTLESVEVEIKKVKINVEVKMLRTEFYNSDTGVSSYYYERY